MPAKVSDIIIGTFINHFNYCNDQNKRNSKHFRKFFSSFFDRSRLTHQLENISNQLVSNIHHISVDLPEEEKIKLLFAMIRSTMDQLFVLRDESGSDYDALAVPDSRIKHDPDEINWGSSLRYHYPQNPGLFEAELGNALFAINLELAKLRSHLLYPVVQNEFDTTAAYFKNAQPRPRTINISKHLR